MLAIYSCIHATTLTLSDAENKAVATSFEMRAQHFEERSKEWEKRNAIANYLPTVDYGFDYQQMDEDIVNAANEGFESFSAMQDIPFILGLLGSQHDFGDSLNQIFAGLLSTGASSALQAEDPFKASRLYQTTFKHSITVTQPITNGGVEIIAIGIAQDTKQAIELQQEAMRQQVVFNTRKAYFDALAAVERTIVANQELSWTRQNLANARMRHSAGAVPMTDLLQWEAEEAQKLSNVLTAQATERFMLLTLFQAMGVQAQKADSSVRLQPLEIFEKWYSATPALADGSVEDNPQMKSVEMMTNVAARSKKVAVAQFMPRLNTFFSYSWPQFINEDHNLELREEQKGWAAGITATVPIFSGLRNSTNYKKASYAYMKAEVERQQLYNQFSVNLRRIRLFHKAAFESVKAAKKQQELMEKNLDIMQKRYDGGLVNQSQLLEVSLGARMAKIGYIQKLFECLMLESEYLLATGKLEATQ
jgi:outer membrane protein